MKRFIGFGIWALALMLIVTHMIREPQSIGLSIIWIPVGALLIYNWNWGNQKGHMAHLAMLVAFLLFVIMGELANRLNLLEALIAVGVILVLVGFAVIPNVRGFYDDYFNGIKRDHFTGESTTFFKS